MNTTGHHQLLFRFETELAESLIYLPMVVRFKLDTCGLKLKLAEWRSLSIEDRRTLMGAPCMASDEIRRYREAVISVVERHTGGEPASFLPDPAPEWQDETSIPDSVVQRVHQIQLATPGPAQWRSLTALQRYTLVKLARSRHDENHFIPALQEFGWS
jgi:hypothetical protein